MWEIYTALEADNFFFNSSTDWNKISSMYEVIKNKTGENEIKSTVTTDNKICKKKKMVTIAYPIPYNACLRRNDQVPEHAEDVHFAEI